MGQVNGTFVQIILPSLITKCPWQCGFTPSFPLMFSILCLLPPLYGPLYSPAASIKKKKKKKLQREWSSSFLQTHSSWIVFKSLSDCTGTFEHIQKGGVFVLQPEFLHANCFFPHKVSWAGNLFTTSSWWHFKAKANLYSCLQQRLNL